ncbi:MAG: sugar phosphate nucleotidyltransferase [Gemmatimonadaceae bacterium]|jgi:glucose-1-phosphate thymidylyltransferase
MTASRPPAPRATTAVILARGLGTRMRAEDEVTLTPAQAAAAVAGAKGLIPIAGYPLLDHVLSALADGGITEVIFVVAPGESAIRQRYTHEAVPTRVGVHFAEQVEPKGTADALLAARTVVESVAPHDAEGRAHFLMCNADNLYPSEAVAMLVGAAGPALIAFDAASLVAQGNIEETRVTQFALLDVSPDGVLREIVEKPAPGHPLRRSAARWVSMNLWRFSSAIFDDCAAVRPSPRGELELTDAVRRAMRRGMRFAAPGVRRPVLDLSRRSDVPAVEAHLAGRVPQL